jgi:phage-related minor tail protein
MRAYQSSVMNGQHDEFNRLLGLGNQLLMARQGLANVPLRLPQADLDKKQTDALEKSRRDLELSRLKGEAKERLRLSYAADDLGLTSDPQFQTGRQELINNGLAEWRNNEANKPKAKGGKTEGEKTEDVYKRLIKQQKEQIALQGQNTELAKVKYQVSQGELASLTEAQKKTVLQNAALIDQVKLREQLRNYEANLADSNASARAANEAQLLGYGQGTGSVKDFRSSSICVRSLSRRIPIFSASVRLVKSTRRSISRGWHLISATSKSACATRRDITQLLMRSVTTG